MQLLLASQSGVLFVGLGTALAASITALRVDGGCRECSRAARLVPGLKLGAAGFVYYPLLLAVLGWLLQHPHDRSAPMLRGALEVGVLIAAGVHTGLAALLLRHRVYCRHCFAAAGGAWLAAGALLAASPEPFPGRWLLFLTAAAGSFTLATLLKRGREGRWRQAARAALEQLLASAAPPHAGTSRVVIYTRPRCPSCAQLCGQVEALRAVLDGSMVVEEQPAAVRMAVPTVVVLGETNTTLVGLHPPERLRAAVELAMGVRP